MTKFLRLFIACAVLSCPLLARAQEQYADSTTYSSADTSYYADDTEMAAEEDEEPARPVIYNKSAPTAQQWQQATADNAYGYRDKKEYIPKKPKEPKGTWIIDFLVALVRFFSSTAGQILLWLAVIIIIGLIAYRLIKGQGGWIFARKDPKMSTEADSGELSEQSLLEEDWELRMQQALKAGDSRTAIRYSYLGLLQLLQQRELIQYRPDKTNIEYYRELADKPQRQLFRTVSRQYEWAWYGNILPERATLDSYLQSFSELKKSLGN